MEDFMVKKLKVGKGKFSALDALRPGERHDLQPGSYHLRQISNPSGSGSPWLVAMVDNTLVGMTEEGLRHYERKKQIRIEETDN
jgi:hypothetical protein